MQKWDSFPFCTLDIKYSIQSIYDNKCKVIVLYYFTLFSEKVEMVRNSDGIFNKISLRILLTFLFFIDVSCITGCITIAVCSYKLDPSELPLDYMIMIKIAIVLGMYGLTSTLCNCLAIFAIKKKNRVFLIPYLVFLPLTATSLLTLLVKNILTRDTTPESLFIPLTIILVLTVIWLKMLRNWINMAVWESRERVDLERLGSYRSQLRSPRIIVQSPSSPDLPPSYDNVGSVQERECLEETPPPSYSDATDVKCEKSYE